MPAPATLELLAGAEVEAGGDTELTTPTGAAILAASVTAYGPLPPMKVVGVGWGAGDRELPDRPNLLRVVAGVRAEMADAAQDEVAVVEANVDDMNPELCEPLLEALFAAGALDAWFTPIVMKKSRPALTVAALCPTVGAGRRGGRDLERVDHHRRALLDAAAHGSAAAHGRGRDAAGAGPGQGRRRRR